MFKVSVSLKPSKVLVSVSGVKGTECSEGEARSSDGEGRCLAFVITPWMWCLFPSYMSDANVMHSL
jgi:hypothetical protein